MATAKNEIQERIQGAVFHSNNVFSMQELIQIVSGGDSYTADGQGIVKDFDIPKLLATQRNLAISLCSEVFLSKLDNLAALGNQGAYVLGTNVGDTGFDIFPDLQVDKISTLSLETRKQIYDRSVPGVDFSAGAFLLIVSSFPVVVADSRRQVLRISETSER
jgi:hypothetical protein